MLLIDMLSSSVVQLLFCSVTDRKQTRDAGRGWIWGGGGGAGAYPNMANITEGPQKNQPASHSTTS